MCQCAARAALLAGPSFQVPTGSASTGRGSAAPAAPCSHSCAARPTPCRSGAPCRSSRRPLSIFLGCGDRTESRACDQDCQDVRGHGARPYLAPSRTPRLLHAMIDPVRHGGESVVQRRAWTTGPIRRCCADGVGNCWQHGEAGPGRRPTSRRPDAKAPRIAPTSFSVTTDTSGAWTCGPCSARLTQNERFVVSSLERARLCHACSLHEEGSCGFCDVPILQRADRPIFVAAVARDDAAIEERLRSPRSRRPAR